MCTIFRGEPRGAFRFHTRSLIFGLLLTLAPLFTSNAEPLVIDGDSQSVNATRWTEHFASLRPLSFREMRAKPRNWRRLKSSTFDGGMSRREHWFRMVIKNTSERSRFYLAIPNNRLDFVDFWHGRGDSMSHVRLGDRLPLPPKALTSYPVLTLDLEPGPDLFIFMRVRSESSVSFPISLIRSEEFGAALQTNRILHLLFLVFAAGNLLIQVRIHQRIGERSYWYMIGLILSGYLYIFLHIGDGNRLLWPDWIWGKNRIHVSLAPMGQMFLLLFCRSFLETRERSPRLDYAMRFMIGVLMVIVPLVLFPISNILRTRITILATLAVMTLVIAVTIMSLGKGRRSALYLLTSWLIMMIASGIYALQLVEVIPANYFTMNALIFAGPADIIVLTVSVFSRQRQILREHAGLRNRLESLESTKSVSGSGGDSSARRLSNIDSADLLEKFMRLLSEERFYLDEDASLSTAAQKLNVRVDQLSTVLNRELNSSFTAVLNGYRILRARSLMETAPGKNILEIARDCGFGSRTSFNRVFKNSTGMAPREYREQITGRASTGS